MDLEHILSEMSLEEKAALCSGADFWSTKALERLGIPGAMMCDGPHGLRKQEGMTPRPCWPASSVCRWRRLTEPCLS